MRKYNFTMNIITVILCEHHYTASSHPTSKCSVSPDKKNLVELEDETGVQPHERDSLKERIANVEAHRSATIQRTVVSKKSVRTDSVCFPDEDVVRFITRGFAFL